MPWLERMHVLTLTAALGPEGSIGRAAVIEPDPKDDQMRSNQLSSWCTCILGLLLYHSAYAHGDDLAIDAVIAHQELIGNVSAKYRETRIRSLPPAMIKRLQGDDPAGGAAVRFGSQLRNGQSGSRAYFDLGTTACEVEFKHVGQRTYYEEHITTQPADVQSGQRPPLPSPRIVAVTGIRVERRYGAQGIIHGDGRVLEQNVFEIALALRAAEDEHWLSAEDWSACDVATNADGTVVLTRRARSPIGDGNRIDHWYFDPALDYSLIKYECLRRRSNAEDFALSTVVENSEFRETSDGVVMPHAISARDIRLVPGEEKPFVTAQVAIEVISYSIGSLKGIDEEFLVKWPDKFDVIDARNDHRIYTVDRPAEQLTDEVIRTEYSFGADSKAHRISTWTLVVSGNLILLVICAVVYLLYRYRQSVR